MKKIFNCLIILLFASNAIAQQQVKSEVTKKSDQSMNHKFYCAELKADGTMGIAFNGRHIPSPVTLTNGDVVRPDAVLVKKDGMETIMENGQCIDTYGNMKKAKTIGKVPAAAQDRQAPPKQ